MCSREDLKIKNKQNKPSKFFITGVAGGLLDLFKHKFQIN